MVRGKRQEQRLHHSDRQQPNQAPAPPIRAPSELFLAVKRAQKGAAREAFRMVAFGFACAATVSVPVFSHGRSVAPTRWDHAVAIGAHDALTMVAAILGSVIAINVAVALLPRPSAEAPSEQVAAEWVWSSIMLGVVRGGGLAAVGIALLQLIPGPDDRQPALRFLTCTLAAIVVAVSSTLILLARNRDQAVVVQHSAELSREKFSTAAARLGAFLQVDPVRKSSESNPSVRSRAGRGASYIAWGAVCSTLALLGWIIPLRVDYGDPFFHHWTEALLSISEIFIYFVCLETALMLVAGVGLCRQFLTGSRMWAPLTWALLFAPPIGFAAWGWVTGVDLERKISNSLLIICSWLLPAVAVLVGYIFRRGPGATALQSVLVRWDQRTAEEDARIRSLMEEIEGKRASTRNSLLY